MSSRQRIQTPVRVGVISLGCAKNLVDTEIMLGALLRDGFEITNNPAQADVMVVNTCSFIDAAQEESVNAILENAAWREVRKPRQGLIVAGCLPQRFREDLPKLLPEVDAFMGIDQVAQVPEIVREAMARRAGKVRSPKSEVRRKSEARDPKRRIAADLTKPARLQPARSETAPPNFRGTDQFAKTPVVISAGTPPAARDASAHPASRTQPPAPSLQPPASDALLRIHARPTFIPDVTTPRLRVTPRHFAYLKIAEGCNHPCSFCIIPRIRGSYRSRASDDIVREARRLIADGVKELNLISQDTTFYGVDLWRRRKGSVTSPHGFQTASPAPHPSAPAGERGSEGQVRGTRRGPPAQSVTAFRKVLAADGPSLGTLLRELNGLPGDFWIRLLYTHPAHWTDDLIRTMAECPKVARYVDLPLQHIHDLMLERMRRETSRAYLEDLIARLRAGLPGVTLRTTFIVGFPGETEVCFQSLLEFIRLTKFERLGVFAYSQEDGTRAGGMEKQVPARIRQQRRDLAMAEQQRVARAVAASFAGRTLKVLVEREAGVRELREANLSSWEHGMIREAGSDHAPLKGRHCVARSEADAPDIDGKVYVQGSLPCGEFATVKIVGHTDYDLVAQPTG